MRIYPAIDIKDGKCVRLIQGDFSKVTEFPGDPVEMALKWEKLGAEYVHVVDLDGARLGSPLNLPAISGIAQRLGIPVQMGGGIRTIEMLEMVFNKGVQRAILGTSAIKDKPFVEKALKMFPGGIAIGIDAREGMAAFDGWTGMSSIKADELALEMCAAGASTIIYTDIATDGMLSGPNLKAMDMMARAVGDKAEVIASGGVRDTDDIRALRNTGVAGVIIGKALYTGDIVLGDAIAIGRSRD
ncbi:MAG: 1-(5-phosphoribosyl)-5-[(5-phosphoribosylamino)methylideneamino]imidazole-4-carboxamide isomerase [Eubacteriales bacterium]|nr:1-(5-phosphoribosyl)-5-[(5-phosphoribosylamino)methylideneamino]imidazole-4-carboxamide isomerase [Eubacteriales bacterium]